MPDSPPSLQCGACGRPIALIISRGHTVVIDEAGSTSRGAEFTLRRHHCVPDHSSKQADPKSAPKGKPGPPPLSCQNAKEFLAGLIRSSGTIPQAEAQARALSEGIKESTFHKALKELLKEGYQRHEINDAYPRRFWLMVPRDPAAVAAAEEFLSSRPLNPHPQAEDGGTDGHSAD